LNEKTEGILLSKYIGTADKESGFPEKKRKQKRTGVAGISKETKK
jgi:hypothetical protein